MDERKDRLVEQDAPGKNTDQAFVKVGEDGKPVMPESSGAENTANNAAAEDTDDDEEA